MLMLGKRVRRVETGEKILQDTIRSRRALNKFMQMIERQGGDKKVIDNYNLLPKAQFEILVKSPKSGYVSSVDTKKIGLSAVELGAGREKKEDKIDHSVGFLIKKKVGDYVKRDEVIAKVLANEKNRGEVAKEEILSAYKISKTKSKRLKKTLYLVDEKGVTKL